MSFLMQNNRSLFTMTTPMSIRLPFFIFFLFTALLASAQPGNKPAKKLSKEAIEQLKLAEDTLGVLAFVMVNDSIEQERFAACRELITRLVKALKTDNSYKYPFDRLKSISILSPPDSSFRIFTWQLFVNDSTYRYYGAIQRNTGALSLFPLIDRSDDLDEPLPTHETLTPERWYGALYYNIRQFDTKQGRRYLLMGFDAYSFFEKRKVVDVLGFDQENKPFFGAPVFERAVPDRRGPELRLFLQYSAESSVKCNWDELYQMVLMEHLIPMGSPFGRGVTAVPDGSYDGLQLEKGRWKFIDKVFNDSQSEAPTVVPVAEKDKTQDVFGKPKKPRKGKMPPLQN
jgi:hypothetical protein